MGKRASETLKEIESIRSGLDDKLEELERRVPPVLKAGRGIAALALGGGAGGSIGMLLLRRLRKRKKEVKGAETVKVETQPPPTNVTVNLVPKEALPVLAAAAVLWAGVRFMESRRRAARGQGAVRNIGDAGRRA